MNMHDLNPSDRAVSREPEAAVRDRAQAPKERPILFSGAMVRALLDGSKTQTRRVFKAFCPSRPEFNADTGRWEIFNGDEAVGGLRCPYGAPGEQLWVRESWAPGDLMVFNAEKDDPETILYRADRAALHWDGKAMSTPMDTYAFNWGLVRWKPSIHMPRWASRITLEVTGVRVERLQDISEEDARAEGIVPFGDGNGWHTEDGRHYAGSAAAAYLNLWADINGTASAEANPWVWTISFRKTASGCSHTAGPDEQSNVDDQEPTTGSSHG